MLITPSANERRNQPLETLAKWVHLLCRLDRCREAQEAADQFSMVTFDKAKSHRAYADYLVHRANLLARDGRFDLRPLALTFAEETSAIAIGR